MILEDNQISLRKLKLQEQTLPFNASVGKEDVCEQRVKSCWPACSPPRRRPGGSSHSSSHGPAVDGMASAHSSACWWTRARTSDLLQLTLAVRRESFWRFNQSCCSRQLPGSFQAHVPHFHVVRLAFGSGSGFRVRVSFPDGYTSTSEQVRSQLGVQRSVGGSEVSLGSEV